MNALRRRGSDHSGGGGLTRTEADGAGESGILCPKRTTRLGATVTLTGAPLSLATVIQSRGGE